MAQAATLRVVGYKQFLKACNQADKETKKYVRETLRASGDVVKTDASRRFARYDAKSAAGYRTRVRQRGVAVEQSLRKTTGKHPELGALQMRRALLPALAENEDKTIAAFNQATDEICRHFERTML